MIYMISGTVLGIVLGLLALWLVPQKTLGWFVLAAGALALAFMVPVFISILIPIDVSFISVLSVPLGLACLITGIGLVLKAHRPWQVWLGLGMGAIPILFWLIFGLGEILYPH